MGGQREPAVAKEVRKEANTALAQRNLQRALRSDWIREGGVPMLSVRTTVRIPVVLARPLPGRWSVYFNWLFEPIPLGEELQLLRSSFGLNVADLASPTAQDVRNVVRYDVDNRRQGVGGSRLGRHINVWQPAPIDDNVHYPVLSPSADTWSVEEVLSFFLSEALAGDLNGRLG